MKSAVLSLIVLFLLSSAARAQPADQNIDPDALRHCQSYLECALIWGGCSDVAINKKFVAQFKPATVCDASTLHNPKAVPTCTDHLCVAVVPDEKK